MLIDYLSEHAESGRISFHMPGHKGSQLYKRYGFGGILENLMDMDITEIYGADNLQHPQGIIDEIQREYESLYDAEKSFLLVNGSSAGIIAAILSSVKPGDKLLMSRGSHKSAYGALTLGNIRPVYVQPQQYGDAGIIGAVSPKVIKAALENDDNISAVFMTSPNYYGVCSDIEKIADIVHGAGKILIVDQAHGAHLKFFGEFCDEFHDDVNMPKAAEISGADIVINSTHKTLASFTQSAVLNVLSDRIDVDDIQEKLNTVQTTSPSYLLMLSLAVNAKLIKEHGKELFNEWNENIHDFYKRMGEMDGVRLIDGMYMDKTKLNIDVSQLKITGKEFEEKLRKRGIDAELVTGDIIMAMTGVGNTESDYKKLWESIKDISEEAGCANPPIAKRRWDGLRILPQGIVKVHGEEKQLLSIRECVGKISAGMVVPYPPGIPLICPGEEFTQEIIDELVKLIDEETDIIGISGDDAVHIYKK